MGAVRIASESEKPIAVIALDSKPLTPARPRRNSFRLEYVEDGGRLRAGTSPALPFSGHLDDEPWLGSSARQVVHRRGDLVQSMGGSTTGRTFAACGTSMIFANYSGRGRSEERLPSGVPR